MEQEQKIAIYVIRHAQSQHNLAEIKCHEANEDFLPTKFSMELIDCGITEFGYEQAKTAAEELKSINIKLVIVSPLRRALATAMELFKNHPNNPTFKVIPIVREYIDSACDIPDDLEKIKKEFPQVDFSEMDSFKDKDMWILESLFNETLKADLTKQALEAVKNTEDRGKAFREFITKVQRQMYPTILDPPKEVRDRSIKAKQVLKEKFKDFKEGEIALVGHSAFLYRFTATKFQDDATPVDGIFMKNCQVLRYEF